jgi:hypothetical protein
MLIDGKGKMPVQAKIPINTNRPNFTNILFISVFLSPRWLTLQSGFDPLEYIKA